MRIVFAYNMWSERAEKYNSRIVDEGKIVGLDVVPFVLTPDAPRGRFSWEELDFLWRRRKLQSLMEMHDSLLAAVQNADVLWVHNGANFHPDWLKEMPENLLTIYGCYDDPESSRGLSEPVAPYFDACFVGNIAAIPMYQKWGCQVVEWGPIFCVTGTPGFTEAEFMEQKRSLPLVFCGERESLWRRDRLDAIAGAFPNAAFYGRGWPNGFIPDEARLGIYARALTGINLHNSTGPINLRMFELPAHGVMQFCDNKCRLGSIFALDKEVIGYDSTKEAIERIKYYLNHTSEARDLAWKGYKRYWADYSPRALWKRAASLFARWREEKFAGTFNAPQVYHEHAFAPTTHDFYQHQLNYYQTSVAPIGIPPYNHYAGSKNDAMTALGQCLAELGERADMIALDWTIASMLGAAKKIVDVRHTPGFFASEAAADPKRRICCLTGGQGAGEWGHNCAGLKNIEYSDEKLENLASDSFDLLVSIGIAERLEKYAIFLGHCARVAPRAIIATPNRYRNGQRKLAPECESYAQEWSAGEFYFLLKCFWDKVMLYSMPNKSIPLCIPVDVETQLSPVIAMCAH